MPIPSHSSDRSPQGKGVVTQEHDVLQSDGTSLLSSSLSRYAGRLHEACLRNAFFDSGGRSTSVSVSIRRGSLRIFLGILVQPGSGCCKSEARSGAVAQKRALAM